MLTRDADAPVQQARDADAPVQQTRDADAPVQQARDADAPVQHRPTDAAVKILMTYLDVLLNT